LPVDKAAIWSLLAGYLLLPSGTSVDVPLLPPIDKFSVTTVTTFLLCWMRGTTVPRPKCSLLVYSLAAIFVISPVFTSLNNSYELSNANHSIPGFYPLDAVKYSLHNLIVLAPFFVGLRFLSSRESRVTLLLAFPTAALFYSIPMLFEVRMSPQLHRWVYGYFPHSFAQQARDGGFRPVVFLGHGLEVALFTALAVIASVVVARAKWPILNQRAAFVVGYLSFVLLLCKTLGAALYAIVAGPLIMFTRPRTWLSAACALVLLVCAYPMLRSFDLIPVEKIATAASGVSADRGSSFEYRVQNERLLLTKANEKPLFGWGTWGRSRVYQSESGDDLTVTDGTWIIQYGMFGWFGYLSLFGLFAIAMFSARAATDNQLTRDNIVLAGLGLMLAINLVDLLPNSNLFPFTYLVAGAIAGRMRTKKVSRTVLRRNSEESTVAIAA
jgi:hypothetical protein